MTLDVSVVIPAYNAGRFIAQAIRSVLSQTRPPREVIVVDDGSTDDTAAVVKAFGSRVRYFHQSNARQAAARNSGVRRAGAEVLAFLDADDVWRPDKLERQLTILEARADVGLVSCSLREIDAHGRPGRLHTAKTRGRCFREVLLGADTTASGSTCVVRRSVFHAVGGFGENLSPCEDTDFLWRAAALTNLECIEEPLVFYRIHGENSHLRVELTTPAWQRLYQGAFSHPEVRRAGALFRARCRGRLNYMLAGDHFLAGDTRGALTFGLKAILSWPPVARRLASRIVKHGSA
jgi:glycosyltransferase involved in cell wall biosynthesis